MAEPGVFTQFCLQAVLGLSAVMASTRGDEIDPWYFRTQALVAFAFAVFAALAGIGWNGWLLAGIAWLAFVFWSMGFPLAGRLAFGGLAVSAAWSGWTLLAEAHSNMGWFVTFAVSAVTVAAVYAAMLLGHWYLVWPWMSIRPLVRALALAAGAWLARVIVSAWHLAQAAGATDLSAAAGLLVTHLLIGLGGAAIGLVLAWRCARIRSTQSATGILYAATAMALLGELAASVASARVGWPI